MKDRFWIPILSLLAGSTNRKRILTLSKDFLMACAMAVALSCAIPASAAKKDIDCDTEEHPSCKESSEDSGALFTIEVFFEVGGTFESAGRAFNVPGSVSGNRAEIGETRMDLNLDLVDTVTYLPDCTVAFGAPSGNFAISTARIPKSSPNYTYVSAAFYNFKAGVLEQQYSFRPSREGDGVIADEDNWLPVNDSNTVSGADIDVSVTQGSDKDGPCNGVIQQKWQVVVTPE